MSKIVEEHHRQHLSGTWYIEEDPQLKYIPSKTHFTPNILPRRFISAHTTRACAQTHTHAHTLFGHFPSLSFNTYNVTSDDKTSRCYSPSKIILIPYFLASRHESFVSVPKTQFLYLCLFLDYNSYRSSPSTFSFLYFDYNTEKIIRHSKEKSLHTKMILAHYCK